MKKRPWCEGRTRCQTAAAIIMKAASVCVCVCVCEVEERPDEKEKG